jgi:hypothetical protein
MITGTSCPHPLYRITGVSPHQHAATDDFAEALGYDPSWSSTGFQALLPWKGPPAQQQTTIDRDGTSREHTHDHE